MNEQMEKLMYHAGLTASGCWDELGTYEQDAIEKFAELIVRECAGVALREDHDPYECILKHFGVV